MRGRPALERVEDHDDARRAGRQLAQDAARLERRRAGRRPGAAGAVGAGRHAPRLDRDHARRPQQVLGLVAEDEALERRGQRRTQSGRSPLGWLALRSRRER